MTKKQKYNTEDNRCVAIYARKSRITNKGDSIGVQSLISHCSKTSYWLCSSRKESSTPTDKAISPLSKTLCARKKQIKKKQSRSPLSVCELFFQKEWTHKRRKISLYGLASIIVSIFATVTGIRDRRCAYGI